MSRCGTALHNPAAELAGDECRGHSCHCAEQDDGQPRPEASTQNVANPSRHAQGAEGSLFHLRGEVALHAIGRVPQSRGKGFGVVLNLSTVVSERVGILRLPLGWARRIARAPVSRIAHCAHLVPRATRRASR